MEKKAKASEVYDGQECAEIRHTAARSLDTEKKGGTRIFFFSSVQYRIATICGIAASETYIYIQIHIHLHCSKHYVY